MRNIAHTPVIVVLSVILFSAAILGQDIGKSYYLDRPDKTIPGHPGPRDRHISARYDHGSIADVIDFDSASGWFLVNVGGHESWIVKAHIGNEVTSPQPTPQSSDPSIVVGTWNLEHFHTTKSRGFPEYGRGGQTYLARTDADYAMIARAISDDIGAAVLVLTEINGTDVDTDDGSISQSEELDKLVLYLGENWYYVISESGNAQRIAFLFDQNRVFLNCAVEIAVPRQVVDNKDIFDRDPLVGYFTSLRQGVEYNDFILVGLHLASGQSNDDNHDEAMRVLLQELEELQDDEFCIPQNESDFILTGDMNLSIFHNPQEEFVSSMETGAYDILADTGSYPATRLKGVPLAPGSFIDYIIVSDNMRGSNREIHTSQATVHQSLADGDWEFFRTHYSDHFPVTVDMFLISDDD